MDGAAAALIGRAVADGLRAADPLEHRWHLGEVAGRAQADVDAAGELDWLVAVDSTIVRIHQRGVSARRVGGDAATAPAAARQAAAADARSAGG